MCAIGLGRNGSDPVSDRLSNDPNYNLCIYGYKKLKVWIMQLGMLFIPNPINNSNINSLVNVKLVLCILQMMIILVMLVNTNYNICQL